MTDSLAFKIAYTNTQRKLELMELKDKLEGECKLLDAEVRKLRIIAHNEQADADNLEAPGLKGLLLGLTGKKQERLEQEKTEARSAAQNYEFAKARRESTGQKLSACNAELDSLGPCEVTLRQLLQIPEDTDLANTTRLLSDIPRVIEDISSLTGTLARVSQWGAARAATFNTSGLAGTDDKLRAIENKAQGALEQLKSDLIHVQNCTAPYGISIDISRLQGIENNYLTDLYTPALIDICVDKVTVMLRQIRLQLDPVLPKLKRIASDQTKKHLRMLLETAGKEMK